MGQRAEHATRLRFGFDDVSDPTYTEFVVILKNETHHRYVTISATDPKIIERASSDCVLLFVQPYVETGRLPVSLKMELERKQDALLFFKPEDIDNLVVSVTKQNRV